MRPKVALAYIHPGTVRAEFMDSVCRTITDSRYAIMRVSGRSSADITRARNRMLVAVNALDVDYLWWLDADVVFDRGTLTQLLAHDRPIVSALYYGQHEDGSTFPVGSIFTDGQLRLLTHHDIAAAAGKRLLVGGTGMGCCLIRRDVLDALARNEQAGELWPYAEQRWEYGTTEDDITFCLRARELGFPTVIDTGTIVGHVKDRVIME